MFFLTQHHFPMAEYDFLEGLFDDFGAPPPAPDIKTQVKTQVESLLTGFIPHLQEVVAGQIQAFLPLVSETVTTELARLQTAHQYVASLHQQYTTSSEAQAKQVHKDMETFVCDMNDLIRQMRRDVHAALDDHMTRLDRRHESVQDQVRAEWRAELAACAAEHRTALLEQAQAHRKDMDDMHANTRELIDAVMRFAAQSEEARH
jgi:hypothetical protein